MERLTRADVRFEPKASKYMDGEVKIQDISDKRLSLILNGPTINSVNKDVLRHMVRQLYDELQGYEERERWIPVTERLPEAEKRVLILTKVKGWNCKEYQNIMCGFYEDGNVWCEDSKACWDYEMKREENYDENRDDYRVPEGWFEELLNHIDDYNCVQIGDFVTHWMPLPESPEEGAP